METGYGTKPVAASEGGAASCQMLTLLVRDTQAVV